MPFGSISVDKIENSDGFTLGGSGAAMKNRIINGAMTLDQRNAGASVTPTDAQYTLDRFNFRLSQSSKLTAQQDSSSNTVAGFTSSMKVTSLSAYSVTSSDYFVLDQNIEGYNVADLGWGTANAKTVKLSGTLIKLVPLFDTPSVPTARFVPPLTNLSNVLLVPAESEILAENITKILLVAEVGVIETLIPVISA